MIKKLGKIHIIIISVVGITSLIFLTSFGCGFGHSSLLKKKNINQCCKLFLECAYYYQKTDKTGCSPFATCCKNIMVADICKKTDTRLNDESINNCMNRLKAQ
mgnify:CR=1 FL=1